MFFVNDVNVEKKEAKIAGCGKIAGGDPVHLLSRLAIFATPVSNNNRV